MKAFVSSPNSLSSIIPSSSRRKSAMNVSNGISHSGSPPAHSSSCTSASRLLSAFTTENSPFGQRHRYRPSDQSARSSSSDKESVTSGSALSSNSSERLS